MSALSTDRNAERLLQLSNEVSRIAGTLARLSTESVPAVARAADSPAAELSPETVMQIIRARRLRARYFDGSLFADPAWDIMLDLLHAELAQRRVTITTLCEAAAVPATTALRWFKTMVDRGLLVRLGDPHDARRFFVELAPATSEALRDYFAQIAAPAI